ncbi:MAG: hypothetical protein L6R40_008095 [Gallowayella cf. fulva]|nr:MAG: hypothetical protein L6R40_008095 [Xanthomendoza cf. fulva]
MDLFGAERALATLADHPERLDRARRRFSKSPPFYKSPSPGSTLSNSPNPPSPGAMTRDQELQESWRRLHSLPCHQLSWQIAVERHWIVEACDDRRLEIPPRVPFDTLASEMVKKRWREQGIWDEEWDVHSGDHRWRWKHEEQSDLKTSKPCFKNLFAGPFAQLKDREEQPKEPTLTAEQQAKLEHDREASRPFHQFLWQLNRERDLIRGEPTIQKAAASASLDINTKAYDNIKALWVQAGIWDPEWGVMPGMSWMHERPERLWKEAPDTDTVHAHLRPGSFAIAEVEAEAERLRPPPPDYASIRFKPNNLPNPFLPDWRPSTPPSKSPLNTPPGPLAEQLSPPTEEAPDDISTTPTFNSNWQGNSLAETITGNVENADPKDSSQGPGSRPSAEAPASLPMSKADESPSGRHQPINASDMVKDPAPPTNKRLRQEATEDVERGSPLGNTQPPPSKRAKSKATVETGDSKHRGMEPIPTPTPSPPGSSSPEALPRELREPQRSQIEA